MKIFDSEKIKDKSLLAEINSKEWPRRLYVYHKYKFSKEEFEQFEALRSLYVRGQHFENEESPELKEEMRIYFILRELLFGIDKNAVKINKDKWKI